MVYEVVREDNIYSSYQLRGLPFGRAFGVTKSKELAIEEAKLAKNKLQEIG